MMMMMIMNLNIQNFVQEIKLHWYSTLSVSCVLPPGIDVPALQGNQVKVRVEEMNGGNYTCHLGPDGEYLNHTVIMIQVENRTVILKEKSPEEGKIRKDGGQEGEQRSCSVSEMTNRRIKICCVIGGDWRLDVTEKIRKMVGGGNKMGCGPEADSVQQIRWTLRCMYKERGQNKDQSWRDDGTREHSIFVKFMVILHPFSGFVFRAWFDRTKC